MQLALKCKNISKIYNNGSNDSNLNNHTVLNDISFDVTKGHFVAIYGNSGCGKSTFLNIIGLLDSPTSGTIEIDGQDINASSLNRDTIASIRNKKIGFIFQNHNLLHEFSAEINIAMPLLVRGIKKSVALSKVQDIIELLFSKDELKTGVQYRSPSMLSGGQSQRVAIARALVTSPSLILADEPTGNLDEESSSKFIDLLLTLQKKMDLTILMVTHNPDHASKVDFCYKMKKGKLELSSVLTSTKI